MVFSTAQPTAQPLVLRIELTIVDESVRLRPADAARRVGPDTEAAPEMPRHPEFEPHAKAAATDDSTQIESSAEPQAPAQRADEFAWVLPAFQPQTAAPHEPPVAPAPAAPATDESSEAPWNFASVAADPLASLPAASFATAVPAAAAAAPASSAQAAPQPDLWFLSSEPQVSVADDKAATANGEPSSMLTAVLTILMAVVVVGLVLGFLWLMTSLPILR